MRDTDWAWLAAAVDGEGSIDSLPGGQARISVCNTHRGFIENCKRIMGTDTNIHIGDKHIGGRKTLFVVGVYSKLEILRVAKGLLPHLIIKKDKALKAIRDVSSRRHYRPGPCVKCGAEHHCHNLCQKHYNEAYGRKVYQRYRLKHLGPPDPLFWRKRKRNASGQWIKNFPN